MSSGAAIRTALRCQRCAFRVRRIRNLATTHRVVRGFAASAGEHETFDASRLVEWALAATVLATGTYAISKADLGTLLPVKESESGDSLQSNLVSCEPRRSTTNQPRNVMLHRMRSRGGRGLNEKYKVDWKTVLGEGAYGSVHPARLAATGEKVRDFRLDASLLSTSQCFVSWERQQKLAAATMD